MKKKTTHHEAQWCHNLFSVFHKHLQNRATQGELKNAIESEKKVYIHIYIVKKRQKLNASNMSLSVCVQVSVSVDKTRVSRAFIVSSTTSLPLTWQKIIDIRRVRNAGAAKGGKKIERSIADSSRQKKTVFGHIFAVFTVTSLCSSSASMDNAQTHNSRIERRREKIQLDEWIHTQDRRLYLYSPHIFVYVLGHWPFASNWVCRRHRTMSMLCRAVLRS